MKHGVQPQMSGQLPVWGIREGLGHTLTLGILAVRGAMGQLQQIVLEKKLIAGDALHGLQHVVLQGQVAAGFLLL